MIPLVAPVQLPPVAQIKEETHNPKDYTEDIKPFKTKEEAKEHQKKHGGYLSTNGADWFVLFVKREP